MAKVRSNSTKSSTAHRMRPALTPEARENQMISLAMDLVERRLIEGTASSQETTYFLKRGSAKEQLEMDRLREENKLLKAKTKALESSEEIKTLYENAIRAFRNYNGQGDPDEY